MRKNMTVEDDSLYRGYYKYEEYDWREDRYVMHEGYVGPFTTVPPIKQALNQELPSSGTSWHNTNSQPPIIHAVELQKAIGWFTEKVFAPSWPVR